MKILVATPKPDSSRPWDTTYTDGLDLAKVGTSVQEGRHHAYFLYPNYC